MHPFTDNPDEALSAWGEVALITRIREWLGDANPAAPFGIGDDAAVLRGTWNLMANDSLVYGRHFDDSTPPAKAGAKLLKRNLSDVAAMGGKPGPAVLALMLPPCTAQAWLEAFIRGMADCARAYAMPLVGGDITATENFLGGSLTILGHSIRPLTRPGAQVGDWIGVTGELGGSLRGWHLDFIPRIAEGLLLSGTSAVRACIDLSDGLGKDLPAILPGDGAAALDLEALPVRAAARDMAQESGKNLLTHVFDDGEDHELLFAFDGAADREAFAARWQAQGLAPLSWLGRIVPREGGAVLRDAAGGHALADVTGYEHLR